MLGDLIRKNRSYRRFYENVGVSRETLLELIDLARLSPSGANRQALRFYLSCEPDLNEKVFPTLGWAAYFREWPGPEKGERPAAYLVLVQNQGLKMASTLDTGIAAQSILLGAVEIGLGGCMIGNIDKAGLQAALNIPADYEILLVIAIGKPKEEVVLDELEPDGDIKYWRDARQVHHVPKRSLQELLMN